MRPHRLLGLTLIFVAFLAAGAQAATLRSDLVGPVGLDGQTATTPPPANPGASGNSGSTGSTGTTGSSGATGSTGPIVVKAIRTAPDMLVRDRGNFPDVIKITAEQGNQPKAGVKVDVRVTDEASDSLLYSSQAPTKTPAKSLVVTTDPTGSATISLLTKEKPDANIRITPMLGAADHETADLDQVSSLSFRHTTGLVTGLSSKLSFFQLFVGTTFSNDYDTNGKSTGFGDAGQLIRLTFDTMWRHQGRTPSPQALTRGNWRTDFNAEFSKFPFGATGSTGASGATGATGGTGSSKGLADAFTGHVGLTWEPNAWAHYDYREEVDPNAHAFTKDRSDEWPYDVFRVALFARAGVTTRAQAAGNQPEHSGDTSISRGQLGLRFTHRRSKRPSPEQEDYNVEPIRFVEISFGRFSKYGTKDDARRVILDAGLRVGALSNNVFPIYAGIHLNSGPGPDDLRVFLGLLMKLDELANLIKRAGVSAPTSP